MLEFADLRARTKPGQTSLRRARAEDLEMRSFTPLSVVKTSTSDTSQEEILGQQ